MSIPPVYNPTVPEVENTIAEGQNLLLNNFSTLYQGFIRNHVALDDPDNPGNHTVIQLIEQSQGRTTQFQEIGIYSKEVTDQTDQIFMRYQGNGKEFQLTNYQIYSIQKTPTQEAYFSFLPGGLIVYFGKSLCNGSTTFNIKLDPAICRNIMGINLGGIDVIRAQPNVGLQPPFNGKYHTITLSSQTAMTNQYYLIFGNT